MVAGKRHQMASARPMTLAAGTRFIRVGRLFRGWSGRALVLEIEAIGPIGPPKCHPPAPRVRQIDYRWAWSALDATLDWIVDQPAPVHPLSADLQVGRHRGPAPGDPQDLVRMLAAGRRRQGIAKQDGRHLTQRADDVGRLRFSIAKPRTRPVRQDASVDTRVAGRR